VLSDLIKQNRSVLFRLGSKRILFTNCRAVWVTLIEAFAKTPIITFLLFHCHASKTLWATDASQSIPCKLLTVRVK
jgi:hypothetical protein